MKVLYLDSDVILFKDPFPVLNSYSGYDLIAQKDGYICAGFMYLHPTKETIKLLEITMDLRSKLRNADDQKAINIVIKNQTSVKLFLLPDNMFSSGAVFFKKHSYYWDKISDSQIMMHNNYVIGTQNKLYRLKEMKLYKLDVDGEYSNPNGRYLTLEKWRTYFFLQFYIDNESDLSLAIKLANRLNRSLIIPPIKCATTNNYCTLCDVFKKHCGQSILKNAHLPFKESVPIFATISDRFFLQMS